jgi:hypothetical protein
MSQVRHRPRQDALHQLCMSPHQVFVRLTNTSFQDPIDEDDESIAAGPDEPPLEEIFVPVVAVMCDIDLRSIRVVRTYLSC